MNIAVDAIGTDARPTPDIAGAISAARELGCAITLIGPQELISSELAKYDLTNLSISIEDATDEILMSDKPSQVMKSKPGSSMHVGMELVKNGTANAFVTMGNTGAAHAIATLSTLRRIKGVKRPALSAIFPIRDTRIIFLDIGANADSRAEWLEQYAVMGSIYAESALLLDRPRVATLSNGEEEGKGNELIREAQKRLVHNILVNYIGHIEPKEILSSGADVIVMDGFVGNVFLKTFEAAITYFADVLRSEARHDIQSALGGLLMRGAFNRVRTKLDTNEIGGAPLLGVDGVVIIGHGSGDEIAVKNAIKQAVVAVNGNIVDKIRDGLSLATSSQS